MSSFDVAHIREQGVDLIVVPLDRSFGYKSAADQNQISAELQACAASAGLAGTVVPVWEDGSGRMMFLAPHSFHPFFQSINWEFVAANINRNLTCG
jgi:hypothetical protein